MTWGGVVAFTNHITGVSYDRGVDSALRAHGMEKETVTGRDGMEGKQRSMGDGMGLG